MSELTSEVAVIRIIIIYVTVLLLGATPGPRKLSWDPSFGAEGYKVYAAAYGESWSVLIDITATEACVPNCCPLASNRCCAIVEMPDPEPNLLFFLITAYNIVGESPTEHGDWCGEGYFP